MCWCWPFKSLSRTRLPAAACSPAFWQLPWWAGCALRFPSPAGQPSLPSLPSRTSNIELGLGAPGKPCLNDDLARYLSPSCTSPPRCSGADCGRMTGSIVLCVRRLGVWLLGRSASRRRVGGNWTREQYVHDLPSFRRTAATGAAQTRAAARAIAGKAGMPEARATCQGIPGLFARPESGSSMKLRARITHGHFGRAVKASAC